MGWAWHREADHGVGQRRIRLRMLRPQPAVMVGARKGARDVWVGRLAQQPGARLAGYPVLTRLGQAVAACGATVRGTCR